jgi:hypothetical protein
MLMITTFRTFSTRELRWVKYQPAEKARIMATKIANRAELDRAGFT